MLIQLKILIFSNLYDPNIFGGAERSVQLLAEKLYRKAQRPVVVTIADKDDVKIVNGVKVYYIKFANLYWGCKAKEQPAHKRFLWHMIDIYNPFLTRKIQDIIKKELQASASSGIRKLMEVYRFKHKKCVLNCLQNFITVFSCRFYASRQGVYQRPAHDRRHGPA